MKKRWLSQNVPSEDFDQTARMRRLIWIITMRTYSKVRILTVWPAVMKVKEGMYTLIGIMCDKTVRSSVNGSCNYIEFEIEIQLTLIS